MKVNKVLQTISILLVVVMLLAACSGGGDTTGDTGSSASSGENTNSSESSGSGGDTTDDDTTKEETADPPTATPEPTIPDILVLHPEATDIEITAATDTYVYIIPGMVAEATEYFQTELAALGWEGLGKPTVMGHLATINMQQEGYRLTVSMQDNELSQTTRVQMLLIEQ